MARPSEIVKALLAVSPAVSGATPTSDWGVNISKMPTTPVKVIALFDTGGPNPHPSLLLDYKSVQVQVRGGPNDNAVVAQKAQDIKDRLLGIDSQDVLGDRLVSVTGIGDITFMGRDTDDQPTYSLNFRLIVEPATNSLTHRVAV